MYLLNLWELSSKQTYPPWLTAQVRRYIRRHDRLAAIAKKSSSEIDRQCFRKAQNEVNSLTNQSYQGYLNTVIVILSEDSRAFYHFIEIKELKEYSSTENKPGTTGHRC